MAEVQETGSAQEAERLEALAKSGLMNSSPEAAYDDITALAAQLCEAPVSMMSLVGKERQWFKSAHGTSCAEISTEHSLCAYTIRCGTPLVVPDLPADARFAANPFVTGGMQLRAYAGVPISGSAGHRIGTLCVIDFVARPFSEIQMRQLRSLARQVETHIALRQELEEKQKLMRELEASQRRFQIFMDHSPMAAIIKDQDGRMQFYNKCLADMYGITTEEWLGKTEYEIWPADMAEKYRGADMAVLASGLKIELEERSPLPDGKDAFWRVCKFGFADGNGHKFLGAVAIDLTREKECEAELRGITAQLTEANRHLERLSRVDALTATGNRRSFDEALAWHIASTRDEGHALSLILFDIDHFKQVNDLHGHPYGDEVLASMGKLLRSEVRASDWVCRYGGEEFAILLPGANGDQALKLAHRICEAIRRHPWRNGKVTASAGIAALQPEIVNGADLVAAADQALYIAKRAGRDQAVLGTSNAHGRPVAA